jgi:transcriptional regulator with GAF, ATPase, and Fis domain
MHRPVQVQLVPGSVVDSRYEVVRALATGGLGSVFEARDRVFQRPVALKALRLESAAAVEAFRREFSLLTSCAHPRLARAFDFGSTTLGETPLRYATTELVRGTTLAAHARGRRFAETMPALADALDALGWLHAAGIVHGDVKPDNVLVREDGSGVLIDLSAAQRLAHRPGEISGTLRYLAPEVLAGAPPSPRSDLFALGRALEDLFALAHVVAPAVRKLAARLTSEQPADRPGVEEVLELLAHEGVARARATVVHAEPAEMLGRGDEVRAFAAALDAALRGVPGPRAVIVSGPTGIGKSRLMRELVWRAQLEAAVFEGAPQQGESAREVVERALDRGPLGKGPLELLAARDELARSPTVRVVALDGIDHLDGGDRALLEALVRATQATDSVLWLLAGCEPLAASPAQLDLALRPLDAASTLAWTAPFVTAARPADIVRLTGGHPGTLRGLCSDLARGVVGEADLDRFVDGAADRTRALVAGLSEEEGRALAAMALADRVGIADAPRAALESLEAAGLAKLDGRDYRLARPTHARELLAAIVPATVRQVASELAGGAGDASQRARFLAHAGEHGPALSLLHEHEARFELAPQAWLRAADAAVAATRSAEALVLLAAANEAAGDPRRALSTLARALHTRPPPPVGGDIRHRAARCYEKLGKVQRAMALLGRAPPSSATASLQALCLLRVGKYAEAAKAAEAALATPDVPPPVAAELAETLGLAAGHLGESARALESLGRAVAQRERAGLPRGRVRACSYHALHAYRAGDVALAARGFEEALAIAEGAGYGDLLATAALNLGTARHQLGDWGAALRCYERGLRAAVAFAKERTETTLRFNLAKIHADIGMVERAEVEIAAVRGARTAPDSAVTLALLGLEAEVAAWRGRLGDAARLLADVRDAHAQRGSRREGCEALLHAAEIALAARDAVAARAQLDEAAAILREAPAADLALRHASASAELALLEGDSDAALAEVRRGAEMAPSVSKLQLVAAHEETSAEVFRRRGATALAERHRTNALETWERIASTLPAELAETFWRHPKRAGLRAAPSIEAAQAPRMELVLKLLEVNRRLSSTLDTQEILRLAMDSAIELTGAERGFLILAGGARGKLEVAIARNYGKETVGKGQLKFSQGIAKRVVERGEPVLTVDALADDRFARNASVHGLRLRSIVCVPIRAHGAVLGAVYLDNRFQRGKFVTEDANLLGAFADQIAVALENGRLMSELRARTRALEEEQRRVAELMHQQAAEIDRLAQELAEERERVRVEARREFPDIIGRSAPMRAVLGLVDRVAETDVPVTITGESGTGKELVARAIHGAGARRDRPFVAVNCAALPEALLESELFGHVKGAFTGALRDHGGLFVAARGGTLFLDEIGETSPSVQAKLLRALQEREIRPVGAERVVAVADVRVVCATNRDLKQEVARGRFREDFYYRISVIEIGLPPLRDRMEDIPALAKWTIDKLAARQGRAPWRLSTGALRRLASYAWPGNVRQLENVLARACVMASGDEIGAADLELPAPVAPVGRSRSRADYHKTEEERIRSALELSQWNVCEVSRALGIPRTTLYRKLARYDLRVQRR